MGVWIETRRSLISWIRLSVTPFVGVWIETPYQCCWSQGCWCHTLRGCVDWNTFMAPKFGMPGSHTLRGCVDWNKGFPDNRWLGNVTPFVGVWIETWVKEDCSDSCLVTPFVGVWIETFCRHRWLAWVEVTPFVGVWIETGCTWFSQVLPQVTPFVGVWIETS